MRASANPYPGLRPFRQDESHLFFGRDGQADAILERLKLKHFVGIVGVSGCGKSSLLNAGVFPGLHCGLLATAQREWRIARLQPRDQPLEHLARALLTAEAVVDQGEETVALATSMLKHSSSGMVNLVRGRLASEAAPHGATSTREEVSGRSSKEKTEGSFALLVVVDQFEEIFRFATATSPEEASHFVQLLIEGVRAGRDGLPLYVALAMRSDFQGDCAVFPGLPELVNEAQYLVPRMTLRQREAAIVRPAATEHQEIARSLLDRLLDDMGENPDQLPVLQHALQRTWEAWQRRTGGEGKGEVALADYLAPEVGGMAGAIENHAEEAFRSLGSPSVPASRQQSLIDIDGKTFSAQQRLVGALFRCITERAEDRRPVRRPLPLGTIAEITKVSVPEMVPVIDAFRTQQRTFLTPPEGTPLDSKSMIDISHESLIRNWPRLARWAKQESSATGEFRRLRESSNAFFVEKTQGPIEEIELSRVERWRKGIFPDNPLAEPQIVPSKEWARLYAGADAAEAFRQIQGYIDESERLLNHRRRKERSTRVALRGLLGLLVLAAVFFAIQLYRSGKEKALNEQKRGQIITFARIAEGLALPIVSTAKSALAEAEQQTERVITILGGAGTASPPDRAAIDDLLRTQDVAEKAIDAMEKLANSMKEAAVITNDTRLFTSAFDLASVAPVLRSRRDALQRKPDALKAIQVAMEKRLTEAERDLAGLNPNELNAELVKAKRQKEIPAATANLSALDAIHDAALALGFEDKDVEKFQMGLAAIKDTLAAVSKMEESDSTAPRLAVLTDNAVALEATSKVNRVRFAPVVFDDAPLIASAGEDRILRFWREDGRALGYVATSSPINEIAFSPKGDAIAAASNGSTVRVFRWSGLLNTTAIRASAFERHSDSITDVEFSHNGERIASASGDRTVRVFDSRSMAQLYFTSPPLPGIVTSIQFHRRDNLVISGCDDGGVRLHNVDQPAIQLLGRMDAPARRPEFSYDGKLAIAASGDRTARVWTVVEPREIVTVRHPAPVSQATFRPVDDPEGYTFITCATNGEVRSVRMPTVPSSAEYSETVLEPRHPGAALSASWSADGRWLATVGGGEVLVWEWASVVPVARLRLSGLHPATSLAEFSPDARLMVSYGGDNTAYVWDLMSVLAR